jgi:protocatechuate 3,4-dioxygenase beta subunit
MRTLGLTTGRFQSYTITLKAGEGGMAGLIKRREFILCGLGALITTRAVAQLPPRNRSVVTPPQIEGPFYPYDYSFQTDTDLVRLGTDDAPALGQVVHFLGTVRAPSGRPVRNATVELWQADARGKYRHPADTAAPSRDANFQGYGRTKTDEAGGFRFRTIRPPAYLINPAGTDRRAPHFHLAVSTRGVRRLTTQLYIEGEALNDTDHWLHMVADPAQRASLIRPMEDGTALERNARRIQYDIVMIA